MPKISVNKKSKKIEIPIPLTNPRGKFRVKRFSDSGRNAVVVSTRSEKIDSSDYIELQIGYDCFAETNGDVWNLVC